MELEYKIKDMHIPFYNDKFENLKHKIWSKIWSINTKEDTQKDFLKAMKQGVEYYYQCIKSTPDLEETEVRRLCKDLVESMRISLNAYIVYATLTNDTKKQLTKYQEYLQDIEDKFWEEEKEENINYYKIVVIQGGIKNKLETFTLYSKLEYCTCEPSEHALCIVIIPLDEDLTQVEQNMPMLVHELSHLFRFSKRNPRNKFVIEYTMGLLSKRIIRELIQTVDGCEKKAHIPQPITKLQEKFSEILKEEFLSYSSNTTDMSLRQLEKEIEQFFVDLKWEGQPAGETKNIKKKIKQEITKLANLTEMNWMKNTKRHFQIDEEQKKAIEIVNKIFSNEELSEINVKDLQNTTFYLTKQAGIKLKKDFRFLIENGTTDQYQNDLQQKKVEDLRDELLYTIMWGSVNKMSERINCPETVKKIKPEYITDYQEMANRVMEIRIHFDALIEICNQYDDEIVLGENDSQMLKEIYSKLNRYVNEETDKCLECRVAEINKWLRQIGLLGSIKESDRFIELFMNVFHGWNIDYVCGIISEEIQTYQEIFADLCMCKEFDFSEQGYWNYMSEKILKQEKLSSSMRDKGLIKRMAQVLTVIHEQENGIKKDKYIIEKYSTKQQDELERWRKQFSNRIMQNNKEDEHFKEVYKLIKDKNCFNVESNIVNLIGKYYNCPNEENIHKIKENDKWEV